MAKLPLTPSAVVSAWKKIGETSGSNKLSLDFSSFNEIQIIVKFPDGSYDVTFCSFVPSLLATETITNNRALVEMGGYSSLSAQVYLDYTADQIWIGDVRNVRNGSELSESTMIVYAR